MFSSRFGLSRLDELYIVVNIHTGTSRNQLTDDDIFLQTLQVIHLATDRRIRQCLCGFLEGSRRQEAVRAGSCLCDTLQQRNDGHRLQVCFTVCNTLCNDLVDSFNLTDVRHGAVEQIAVTRNIRSTAGIVHLDLAEHLTHDNLDVLVVDVYTLLAVYLLYFADDIVLYSLCAQNIQDVSRIYITLGQAVTLRDSVAFIDTDLVVVGNEVLFSAAVIASDDERSGGLDLLNVYDTVNASNDCRILGLSALEQFLDTGKTLCNIFCVRNTAGMEGTHGQLCTRWTVQR